MAVLSQQSHVAALKQCWKFVRNFLPSGHQHKIGIAGVRLLENTDRRLRRSKSYSSKLNKMLSESQKKVSSAKYLDSSDYDAYVNAQLEVSIGHSNYQKRLWATTNQRTKELVTQYLAPFVTPKKDAKVLCVGCRDTRELDFVESAVSCKATGLDLFSFNDRIVIGDMHKMPFDDNSFDSVYSCHSLEHSWDLDVALSEFKRVVRPEGSITIEIPINYTTNETDLHDLKQGIRVLDHLKDPSAVVLKNKDFADRARITVKVKNS